MNEYLINVYRYVKPISIEKCVNEDIARKRAEIVGLGRISLDGTDSPGLMAATVTIETEESKLGIWLLFGDML